MTIKHTDIVFGLYMNGGEGTLDWLLEFLCGGEAPETDTLQEIKESLALLAATGFLQSRWQEGRGTFTLTERGTRTALAAADAISHHMVQQWRQTQAA